MTPPRPYEDILAGVQATGTRDERMRRLVDLLWERLSPTGVSWIGFYLHERDDERQQDRDELHKGREERHEGDDEMGKGRDELVLGPRRDKPACSPIGLHGACGRSFRERRPMVVGDVRRLGADYVACDPRDQSEVVIPLIDERGACWGVLDADSYDLNAFDQRDVDGLSAALRAAKLTHVTHAAAATIVV